MVFVELSTVVCTVDWGAIALFRVGLLATISLLLIRGCAGVSVVLGCMGVDAVDVSLVIGSGIRLYGLLALTDGALVGLIFVAQPRPHSLYYYCWSVGGQ
jgi:hypothetical protein